MPTTWFLRLRLFVTHGIYYIYRLGTLVTHCTSFKENQFTERKQWQTKKQWSNDRRLRLLHTETKEEKAMQLRSSINMDHKQYLQWDSWNRRCTDSDSFPQRGPKTRTHYMITHYPSLHFGRNKIPILFCYMVIKNGIEKTASALLEWRMRRDWQKKYMHPSNLTLVSKRLSEMKNTTLALTQMNMEPVY